ncbi:MAG: tRNA (guanosine(46)-N7)-methyltransferase TrmB [Kiritimatiellia bacterium]
MLTHIDAIKNNLILPLPAPVLPHWQTFQLFGNQNPLEIDAGSGKGRFLLARAQSFPQINFLGIERQKNRVLKVARKAARAQLHNIRLVQADIAFLLAHLIPDNAIQTLYVFYPDPWPKRRHHNRRLIQPAFLDLAATKLAPGGKIHFATDDIDYAAFASKHFQQHAILKPCPPFQPSPDEKTDFELLFEQHGRYANRYSVQKSTR